jgi:hypothetical protein
VPRPRQGALYSRPMISNHVKQRIKSGKACFGFLVQAAKTARDAVETDA